MNEKFSYPCVGKNVFRNGPDIETLNNCIGNITRRVFDKACTIRFQNNYYYATVHKKIVAFTAGVKCLLIRTFDDRKIIVVDSVSYAAICIDDYEFNPEKEANPDNELFIEKHRVNPVELYNYRRKHISNWNYFSFQKYVEKELEYIEAKYWTLNVSNWLFFYWTLTCHFTGNILSSQDEVLIVFDLNDTEVYTPKKRLEDGRCVKSKPYYPEGWRESFGLPVAEHERALDINILDGYARIHVSGIIKTTNYGGIRFTNSGEC